jgi:hypothetical protein
MGSHFGSVTQSISFDAEFHTAFFMLRLANNDEMLLSHAEDRRSRINPDMSPSILKSVGCAQTSVRYGARAFTSLCLCEPSADSSCRFVQEGAVP